MKDKQTEVWKQTGLNIGYLTEEYIHCNENLMLYETNWIE